MGRKEQDEWHNEEVGKGHWEVARVSIWGALLRGTVGNSVLWKSVVPTTVGEKLVKMETGDRREVMQSLAEEGWTHKHILEAAIPFKRTAWFNRDQQPAEIGRPRKICPEFNKW